MRKSCLSILSLLLLMLFPLSGESQRTIEYKPRLLSRVDEHEMHSWVNARIKEMSLEQQIGQLIMPIIYPKTDKQSILQAQTLVKEIGVGGILYQKGLLSEQYAMNMSLQAVADLPLLISLDGEYGLWMRLKDAPRYPKAMALGHIRDKRYIYWYGRELARQCRLMGIHIDFAPVLDINNNPRNPVIGTRSFGTDIDKVLENGLIFSAGLEDGGILSVAKHFPGHGNTDVDSHKALPLISGSKEDLFSTEIVPFQAYTQAGFGGMMIGHLRVPALETDPQTPASMSTAIVSDLLIRQLGFRGLIFTDAMEMQGMQTPGEHPISVRAVQAGADILLGPTNPKQVQRELMQAVSSGVLSKKEIELHCRKILSYKYALLITPGIPDIYSSKEISGLVRSPYGLQFCKQLWRESIEIKRGADKLPLEIDDRVALLQLGASKSNRFGAELQRAGLKKQICYPTASAAETNRILEQLKSYQTVIVSICSSKPSAFSSIVNRLVTSKRVILCFLTTPFAEEALKLKALPTVLLHAFESCDEAMQAAAEKLLSPAYTYALKLSAEDENLYQQILVAIELVRQQGKEKPDQIVPQGGMEGETNSDLLPSVLPREKLQLLRHKIEEIVSHAIEEKAFPGCQILAIHRGKPLYEGYFGHLTYDNKEQPVGHNIIYDLASITKAAATTPAVMLLIDQGKLSLSTRVEDVLPRFRKTAVGSLRLRELLLHTSGLLSGLNFYEDLIDPNSYQGPLKTSSYASGYIQVAHRSWANPDFSFQPLWISENPGGNFDRQFSSRLWISRDFKDVMLDRIAALKLKNRGRYRYSDLNFVLIQQMIEARSKLSLDEFVGKYLYRPIGSHLCFNPIRKGVPTSRIAPAQDDRFIRKEVLKGVVDDETAACLGGVSGNAGLFGSARDLAPLLLLYANEGRAQGKQIINKSTLRQFTSKEDPRHNRFLGFDRQRSRELNYIAGAASMSTYGHTGFTGTCFWVDPKKDLIFIFLSNRSYPSRTHTALMRLNVRQRIHQACYEALEQQ
ncbi:glycoside hydrolase family 3 N-terminal domain-containing protein [Porphyromonas crevioricanis]|nr:glycoside hydrolase family 3 N-terminal domain-containing protein [Porphyromonas crevioricanis]